MKAAAQNAQKKKDNQLVCQTDSTGYTGTLKTVIKIQRQEKKGSSKAPLKMIYKASSSNSTASVVTEETNHLEPEVEITAKEVMLKIYFNFRSDKRFQKNLNQSYKLILVHLGYCFLVSYN